MLNSPMDFAKAYFDLGWSLIPIIPKTKKPPLKWGIFQKEITDKDTGRLVTNENYRKAELSEVESWINNGWYLAVLTGEESGVLVVDDDRIKNGMDEWGFESTVVAKTQSGGKHYYFRYDREIHSHSNTKIHVDLKAWHSYCLVPPFNGREWIHEPFDNKSLPSIQDNYLETIKSDLKTNGDTKVPIRIEDFFNIPEGARTDSLYRIACSIFNNYSKAEGVMILTGINEKYIPPLLTDEFDYQVSRAWNFIRNNPKTPSEKVKLKNTKEDKKFKLTDTGNAEWIASMYGDKVRFDHRRKRWLVWQGHRWQSDVDQAINRYAIESARQRFVGVTNLEDSDQKIKIAKWATSSESRSKLESATSILKSLLPISDSGDNWDSNKMVLSCPNGILDLKTMSFRDGRPEDRITMVSGCEYDPHATCPRWKRFVDEVFEGNKDLIHYVHKAVGYSITGDMREQVAFFCFGPGSNGKSVWFKTLCSVLYQYAYDAPVSLLQRGNGSLNNTNDLASIEFKRLLVSSETLSTSKLNEQRIKSITGGDSITARYLFSEFFTFDPTCKLWLFVNHKPQVEDDSHGFWRRVRMIPFNRTFAPDQQDKTLIDTLRSERSGILNWMLEGCALWQSEGLNPTPEIVRLATQGYREENDELFEFIADKCSDSGSARASDLYKSYRSWAECDQGLKDKEIMSNTAFGRRLSDKFSKKITKRGVFYLGISLVGGGFEQIPETSEELGVVFDKPTILPLPLESIQDFTPNHSPEANLITNPSPDSSGEK